MSLIYKKGDILKAKEDIICHQVNVDGCMGGGLARQIANKYPCIEEAYQNFCKKNEFSFRNLKGIVLFYEIPNQENKYIANCFTQTKKFTTSYQHIIECFTSLLNFAKKSNLTVAVPYKYGCGIANGDWNIVDRIFDDLSRKFNIDIVVYKLEE